MVTIMAKTLMAVVTGCMAGTGIGILIAVLFMYRIRKDD